MPKKKYTSSTNSKTRVIKVQDDIILYTLKLDGVTDYLSYDDTLLSILKMDMLKPFRDSGRLRLKVNVNGANINMYLYDLAFACYSGMVKAETFIHDIQKYFEYKSFNNLSIDHADNNVLNNTRYNISIMDSVLNQSKGGIVSRVKIPTYINTAYCDKKYRVQVAWNVSADKINSSIGKFFGGSITDTSGYGAMYFICADAESFVDCLKFVTSLCCEWATPLKNKNGWIKNYNPCWCKDIHNSISAQKILANMNESSFQVYTPVTDK